MCRSSAISLTSFSKFSNVFQQSSTMEDIISTQPPSADKLGTLLREAGLSEEVVTQLVCYQAPVVPLLSGRQEQSHPQQQTSQGQGSSAAAERTSALSVAEHSSTCPILSFNLGSRLFCQAWSRDSRRWKADPKVLLP